MALISKPDYRYIWASGGAVVAPSDVKKQTGWTPEVPPHQWANWIENRQDQFIAHVNQRGIPQWDALTEYEAAGLSYTQGSNGTIYKSVAASGPSTVAQNPTTDVSNTYWTVAFADVGAFLTQTTGDARYAQRANNLSDVTNATTARINLGLQYATNAEAITGTAADRVISPASLAAKIATNPFSKEYISPAQTVTLAGSLTLTHGLGARPKFMRNYATCTVAEGGYAVGDTVVFNPVDHQGTTSGNGTMLILDAGNTTTISIKFGNQSFAGAFINRSTGAAFTPTPGSWTISVGAWL